MRATMVIPTYWGREKNIGWKEGDAIYDHPTPLDQEGTLQRAIESTNVLKQKDFELVIIGAATATDIENAAEEKIKKIIDKSRVEVKTTLFSHSHLKKIHHILKAEGKDNFLKFLELRGYPNIRNLCLLVPHLLASEVAILIDDDEYFEDPEFMNKALEFVGKKVKGKEIYGVAGYYIYPGGDYHLKRKFSSWMTYWDKNGLMNKTFEMLIEEEPRLKLTPFVGGGNLIAHKELFMKVPFDPHITRGEDMDFLMNSKMLGYPFYFDNQLPIIHDPPPKPHPEWRKLREDIYRFVFARSKLAHQKKKPHTKIISAEEFDPYPGRFLKEDLNELVFKSNLMLGSEYLSQNNLEGYEECMRNIHIAESEALPKFDPFENLLSLQKTWSQMMNYFSQKEISESILSEISFN